MRNIRANLRTPFAELLPETISECADAGVALVFVPVIAGCKAWGAARWAHPGKALLQLTPPNATDDRSWLNFFHIAGHILLHSKKKLYLEPGGQRQEQEREATAFAREMLISRSVWKQVRQQQPWSAQVVKTWAEALNVPPGALLGSLEDEGIVRQRALNTLKKRVAGRVSAVGREETNS